MRNALDFLQLCLQMLIPFVIRLCDALMQYDKLVSNQVFIVKFTSTSKLISSQVLIAKFTS